MIDVEKTLEYFKIQISDNEIFEWENHNKKEINEDINNTKLLCNKKGNKETIDNEKITDNENKQTTNNENDNKNKKIIYNENNDHKHLLDNKHEQTIDNENDSFINEKITDINNLQFINKDVQWPSEILPQTKYSTGKSMKSLDKLEEYSNYKLSSIPAKKLTDILHCIDIILINNINTTDLVEYTGSNASIAISHIQNKDVGVLNWLGNSAEFRYIEKMLKRAAVLHNYNIMNILLNALQSTKLNGKQLRKLVQYKEMLDNQEGGIFPFEWLLKDCADSNGNADSGIASLRFCKIIEKLEEMKLIQPPHKIKEKEKHMVYAQAWKYLKVSILESIKEEHRSDKLYLVI